jgi:hypothetical protein
MNEVGTLWGDVKRRLAIFFHVGGSEANAPAGADGFHA